MLGTNILIGWRPRKFESWNQYMYRLDVLVIEIWPITTKNPEAELHPESVIFVIEKALF